MNDTTKSTIYILAGVVLMAVGIYALPTPPVFKTNSLVNQPLFPMLKDGNVARSMEIVDGTTVVDDKPVRFEVKQINDQWALPSHNNYPADAKQQLIEASSALVGVKALEEESETNHELYGVLDPTPENRKRPPRGVGKLVVFRNAAGEPLARLIIGKSLRDTGRDTKDSDLRFVRIEGQDPVYTAKLPNDKFSPKFEDWIETDLLKLNSFDLNHVSLRDSTIGVTQDFRVTDWPKQDIELGFDDKKVEWTLEKLVEYDDQGKNPQEIKQGEGEELDTAKLNELKDSLSRLTIVDVAKKPPALIRSLREKEYALDRETAFSLQEKGFFMTRDEGGTPKFLSKDGYVAARLRNGLEYRLYFGGFAKTASKATSAAEKTADGKEKPEAQRDDMNRYLMVDVRFNPDLIAKPDLQPLPGEKPTDEAKPAEAKPADAKTPEDKSAESKPADDKVPPAPNETKSGSDKATDGKDKAGKATNDKAKAKAGPGKQSSARADGTTYTAFQDKDAKEESAKAAKSADTPSDGKEPATSPAISVPPPGDKTNPNESEADKAAREAREAAEFERVRVTQENERKQKEYDGKIKNGEKTAKRLNERFAEWYYVIPDATYKKIHLGKNDIFRKGKLPGGPGGPPNPIKLPQGFPNLPGFPPPGLPGGN